MASYTYDIKREDKDEKVEIAIMLTAIVIAIVVNMYIFITQF